MASDFWLIVGLGNPGKKYEGTRHNMGFMTADILAERWSVAFSDHKGLAMLGKGAMNRQGRNVKFFLAKPLTYMNDSGNAVASISASLCGSASGPPPEKLITSIPSATAASTAAAISGLLPSVSKSGVGTLSTL